MAGSVRRRLVWSNDPVSGDPVANQDSPEAIGELRDRIREHSDRLGYNAFAASLERRGQPTSYQDLYAAAGEFVEERQRTSPIFQPTDDWLRFDPSQSPMFGGSRKR